MSNETTVSVRPSLDRGQVGIGTLIVFVAMVLVAAVAAGVLVETSSFLQTKAEQSSSQSSKRVTNGIDVGMAYGAVSNDNEIVRIDMEISLQAGSGPVPLRNTTIRYQDSEVSRVLTFDLTSTGPDHFSPSDTIMDDDLSLKNRAYILNSQTDRLDIALAPKYIRGDVDSDSDRDGLKEGERATIEIQPPVGHKTVVHVKSPRAMGDQDHVVLN